MKTIDLTKENEEFFKKILIDSLAHFITYQIPFTVVLEANPELTNYLPDFAFSNPMLGSGQTVQELKLLIVDIKNWNLEIAKINSYTNTLDTILVYGEASEYPVSLNINDIFSIIDIETGVPYLNKFFVSKKKPEQVEKEIKSKTGFQTPDEEGIKHSMSKLKLLKPGEEN